MQTILRSALAASLIVAAATSAEATIACSVVASKADAGTVRLFAGPDGGAEVLQDIPVGSLVMYPQEDLAPGLYDGWAWVRFDASQENIWHNGIYGWIKTGHLTDCG